MKPVLRSPLIPLLWLLATLLGTLPNRAMAQCPATISDANFADAIRTLYPALIGSTGNNTLTPAAATYAGELDFRGWGNPTLTSGANSPYPTKPKLTTIEGIGCFEKLTRLNVSNQLLTTLPPLPATLTELRCSTNSLSNLPTLPAGLKVLNCFANQLTALPALPAGFQAIACGANRLTALPELPQSLIYLRCERQYSDAPTGTFTEAKKTLAVLPALPAGLLALHAIENKLTTLPELPASLAYLQVSSNPNLTCVPALPPNFFSAALPSGPYFGFSQTGGVGNVAEPRLNVSSTPIRCLPNAPTGITSAKVNPAGFGTVNAVCSTPPTISITASGCSRAGNNGGRVAITATSNTTLEYSRDSLTWQASNVFVQLPEGPQLFWVRRKDAPVACPSAIARQSVTIETAPSGFTPYSIADANFADAIRTLYPALIGPTGDNRLTEAINCLDGEVDFSGWGNALNSNGDASLFAAKPRLTDIRGVEYLLKATTLNVMNQTLTVIDKLPDGLKTLKAGRNTLTTLNTLPNGLEWLDVSQNAFAVLPTLPGSLKHLNCNTNRLTTLPMLPASLKYLTCQQQHTGAPVAPAVVEEAAKTLTTLPALPAGLRAINCSNNKLSSLPSVPDSVTYFRFFNNLALTCVPALPPNFFNGSITSGTLSPYALTEPRMSVSGTGIICLSGLPAGFNTTKISPAYFGGPIGACSTPPSLSALASCSPAGAPSGTVRLLALVNGVSFGLEYSRDGLTYQDSSAFAGLMPGTYTFYARRKITNSACQPVVAATLAVTIGACNPTTYHVAPSGNDATGDGTLANPWKTIVFATSRVTANKGDTIRLAAGAYEEASRIILPSGVSLVGAGKDKTSIKVNFFYDMLAYPLPCSPSDLKDASFDLVPENFVIQVNGASQVLRGFYLDGQDKKCHGGIYARLADRVIWDELEIRQFRLAGIWTAQSYNSQIRYCKIVNITWGNSRLDFGNIMFYDCDNLRIHHNDIEVNDIGAYGIKSTQNFDKNTCPGGNAPERNNYIAKTFVNVKIYENSIKVPATGTWNNGTAPAITIEFAGSTPRDCEIYNNYINNHVSVPGVNSALDNYQYAGKTAHIHHNVFDLGKDDGSEYRYAIEATVPNMEIDHNFFKGGLYPISMFNAGLGNDPRFTNHLIHHNVFYGARGTRNGQQPQALLNYRSLPSNFKFYNNTVVDNNGVRTLLNLAVAVPRYNAEIINNIFINPTQNRGSLFTDELYVNPTFKRNLFYNIDPFGTEAVVANPILKLAGEQPKPFFDLLEGSPAINKGVVITGITDGFQSTAPDLGAYESPFNSTVLKLLHQDGGRGQKTTNQLRPNLQLMNEGASAVPLEQVTVRYWFTAENYAPINTWVDYAQLGAGKVKMAYTRLAQPRRGADGYVEYAFDGSAGALATAASSGPIQSRIAKQTYTDFNEADDYSYAPSTTYASNETITVYRNGALVWGTEPAAATPTLNLRVQSQNRNHNTGSNSISTYLKLNNEGNVPVAYKDLSIRYWFTAEGTQSLNYWVDYAELGNSKVRGRFVKTTTPLQGADTYFELTIDSTLRNLEPLSSTGNIQYRLAKADWTNFNETNDHSYKAAAPMADNDRITAYYQGKLVYGVEPAAVSGGRLASGEGEISLMAYPNPMTDQVTVYAGTATDPVDVTFHDVAGRVVKQEKTRLNLPIAVGQLPPGLYLLKVQMEHTTRFLKLLKQ